MALSDRRKMPREVLGTGSPCSVGDVYRAVAHSESETAELNALLYEDGLTGREVYEALTAEGYKLGFQTPNRHRGKSCRCFKHENWACRECRYDKGHCICTEASVA